MFNQHLPWLPGREYLKALARNRMRSALSITGIGIGIAAVVCVMAIGAAGSKRAEQQLQSLGDNFIWIEAGSRNVNGVRSGSHGMNTLTMDDVDAIRQGVAGVKEVSPNMDGNIPISRKDLNWTTHYRGVSPEFLAIRRWGLTGGAPFTEQDVKRSANVCLIGQDVLQQLFRPGEDPVGKHVRINNQLFRVDGVLEEKGQTPTGFSQDDTVIMPYSTVQEKIRGKGSNWVDDIMCSAVSQEAIGPATDDIVALLRQRHHLMPGQDNDFNIRHPDDMIKTQMAANRTLALFLISIASISLLVGGIGIMNVMLVTVAERTREIGLRMAVGATVQAIRIQFLGEAITLSLAGGLIGVLLGVAGSFVFGAVLGWRMAIPPESLIIAPAFSAIAGVCSGIYPAWKATQMDPVAALRLE
ncbi:MAG: ABC transporter permease [Nitrospiraceae bacterium]|nr:ABC transporter permease [Nitrospiraceae bacterium]